MSKVDIYTDGPMHPDMFDGETPIRTKKKVDLHAYEVEVTWMEPDSGRVTVVAKNEDEAIEKAMEYFGATSEIHEWYGDGDIVEEHKPADMVGGKPAWKLIEEEATKISCT